MALRSRTESEPMPEHLAQSAASDSDRLNTDRRWRAWRSRAALAVVLVVGLAVAAVVVAEPGAPAPPSVQATSAVPAAPAGAVGVACPQSVQSLVDGAAPGATVRVPSCVYRETVSIRRPVVLVAEPGAEIRGSDVWDPAQFQLLDGVWHSTDKVPPPRVTDFVDDYYGDVDVSDAADCRESTGGRCRLAEQVFVDGRAFEQVATRGKPGAGQFALDGARRVVLGESPAGHVVEVTTREYWIRGLAGSDGTVIRGFGMRHAKAQRQQGALEVGGHRNWLIVDNDLSDAHGALVALHGASDSEIRGNVLQRAGQQAIEGDDSSGEGRGNRIIGNTITGNNTEAFDPDWQAGGIKITTQTDLHIIGNIVSDNDGPGIWCDLSCRDLVVSGNRVSGNSRAGIFVEISTDAMVSDNVVWENGWDPRWSRDNWGFGAGILLSTVRAVEVRGNVLAWNNDGISVISQPDREGVPAGGAVGLAVIDNAILHQDGPGTQTFALGWLEDGRGVLFDSRSANRGDGNAFWFATSQGDVRFAWNGDRSSLSTFATTPGGRGSHLLSTSEKDVLVARHGIPASPIRRG